MRQSILAILLLIFLQGAYSQKAPIKFGKPEVSDLEMSVYPLDSSASAVILCDYGYFNEHNFQFTRILRIKILTTEGLSWANHTFPVSEKLMVSGYTLNLENGAIVKTKLEKESIFKERITERYYRVRVSMPNVKVGSVIDLEFTHEGLPSEWRFQDIIPVKHSELILEDVDYLQFRKRFVGYNALSYSDNNRWVAGNVPPFKAEPYINSIENYITKFVFEIQNINAPQFMYYKSYADTWKNVRDRLYEHENFAKTTFTTFLNKYANEIKAKYTSPADMVNAAVETIKTVKWNEVNTVLMNNNSSNGVFSDKIGNSAEINFMLMALLEKLDFNVQPIVLSTRDNGLINPNIPTLSGLNYIIVKATKDGQEYIVDATQKYLPYTLLPEHCLNGTAVLLTSDNVQLIELAPKGKDKAFTKYNSMSFS